MEIPKVCQHCEGTEHLTWSLATRLANGAPMDGRLRKNEVVAQLYLGCDECGEVLLTVEDDDELAEVISPPAIQIVIQRPARTKEPDPLALGVLAAVDPLYAAILRIMDPESGNPTGRIAKQLGHPDWKIMPMVAKLHEAGLIKRGTGGWMLA